MKINKEISKYISELNKICAQITLVSCEMPNCGNYIEKYTSLLDYIESKIDEIVIMNDDIYYPDIYKILKKEMYSDEKIGNNLYSLLTDKTLQRTFNLDLDSFINDTNKITLLEALEFRLVRFKIDYNIKITNEMEKRIKSIQKENIFISEITLLKEAKASVKAIIKVLKQRVNVQYKKSFIDYDIDQLKSWIEDGELNVNTSIDQFNRDIFQQMVFYYMLGYDHDFIKFLVEDCLYNVNKTTKDKNNILHFLAKKGYVEAGCTLEETFDYTGIYKKKDCIQRFKNTENFIQLLVDNGLNINEKNNNNKTPLYIATEQNDIDMVTLLLKYGADPLIGLGLKNLKLKKLYLEKKEYSKLWYEESPDKAPTLEEFSSKFTSKESDSEPWFKEYPLDIAYINSNMTMVKIIEEYIDKKVANHNPRKLLKLLSNFTIDKPIKYTTHSETDGFIQQEYGSFNEFMKKTDAEFRTFENELSSLSPRLYKKINTFLFEKNPNEKYSWCSKASINIGWSSLKGLQEWCDKGNNPFKFKLIDKLRVDGRTINTFGKIIELFKQEIEIRDDFKTMLNIIEEIEDKFDTLDINYDDKKINQQFYTDTQSIKETLDKIFTQIEQREDHNQVNILLSYPDSDYYELKITHKDSFSSLNGKDLFDENKSGDFDEIQKLLLNLCDWSVENKFEGKNIRINYLKSNNVKDIEELDYAVSGFTHILRFYR